MSNIPVNIRVPQSLHDKIATAADHMDLPQADVIRQALALGVRDLELIGYDVEKCLHEFVIETRKRLAGTDPGLGPQIVPNPPPETRQKKA
jgi:hypothetical protein